jgi:hypothetical protein
MFCVNTMESGGISASIQSSFVWIKSLQTDTSAKEIQEFLEVRW